MITRRVVRTALLLAAGITASCDFTAFQDYRTRAPVVSIGAPANYQGAAWSTLLAFTTNDSDRDYFVASGGLGTPVSVTALREGIVIHTQNTATYACNPASRCDNTTRIGTALEGVASWGGGTACAATGVFGAVHQVHLSCLTGSAHDFDLVPPMGLEQSGFGLAMASVRRRTASDPNPGEILFVGARAGAGRVLVAQPGSVVDFTPGDVPLDAALGTAMAAGVLRTGGVVSNLIVAAGAPSIRGVMVFRGDPRAGRPMVRVGCFLRDEPGFGGVLAMGDVDGDGNEDVLVGSGAETMGRLPRVHVYLAAAIPTGSTTPCDATSWPEAAAFDCADVPDRGVRCGAAGGLFGSTIAAGDLDGDGRAEIIVGAPHAEVDSLAHAGAIWLLRATTRGPNALDLTRVNVLRSSNPELNTELGTSVLSPHMGNRDEVLAGAPGTTRTLLYLCSGIPGDQPNTGGLDSQCR